MSFGETNSCTACPGAVGKIDCSAKVVFLRFALRFSMCVDVDKQDSLISEGLSKIMSNRI